MEIKQKLETALKEAMRQGDELKKRTIRLALSSIKLAEIDKGAPLDEDRIIDVIQKEIKTREESIEAAVTAGRVELTTMAKLEIEILKKYLPQQLSDEEITRLAVKAIEETDATSPSDMGRVMKTLLPRIKGQAASSRISQVVKNLLDE